MRLTSRLPFLPLWLLFLGLALHISLLTPARALAQDGTDGDGRIAIYVFDLNGLPMSEITVRLENGRSCVTDDEGFCDIETPEGEWAYVIERLGTVTPRSNRKIPVAAGRSTEVLITYNRETDTTGDIVDVETPRGEGLQTTTATATGRIEGVVSNEKNKPVEGARIFVRGAPIDARTDAKGRFVLEEVPAETVDLTVIHPNYGTTSTNDVVVTENQTTTVGIEVLPSVGSLGEFVVTIPKLEGGAVEVLQERRQSSSVADLLGADQIEKSGDSDAASALARVTGITLVDGRYVYVRGLGERYSTTLLDGSTLPSPDPEKRVVPLDLFPASILGSIVVQKTYSPDLPGEFGGGVVNLRTKDVPEDFELKVSVSGGYLTETTFDTALGYDGTSTDFLGFGVSGRSPPPAFQDALDQGRIQGETVFGGGFTEEELQSFALSLNNDFGLEEQTVPMDVGFGLDIGGKVDVGGTPVGLMLGMTYGSSWFAKESIFISYGSAGSREDGDLRLGEPNITARLLDLINEINLGALGVATVDFDDSNRVRFTGSLNRISEDSARLQYGFTNENETRLNRLRWVEQMLGTAQLKGEHEAMFGTPLRLDWRYMFSTATRDEPDRREVAYAFEREDFEDVFNSGFYRIDTQDLLNQRFYSSLLDFNHDAGIDFTLPLAIFGDVESKLKAGVAGILKEREVDTRRFTYTIAGGTVQGFNQLPPSQIFNDETLSSRPGFGLTETTLDNDNYSAAQELGATYLMGDLGFFENLRLLVGARAEYSNQEIETFPPGDRSEPNETSQLETFDLLPAATLTWEFEENMQIRVAGSRTLSRPNFRELSPAVFRDLGGTVEFAGNPELERTTISNADLRYEWYPSPGESFSASFFFKYFENPVEQTATAGSVTRFEPANVPEALNLGGELETRVEFGWIDDVLADMYFAGNLTLVYSQVEIPDEDRGTLTSQSRPLAGQSPWVVNAQLGYDNPEIGLSTSLLYNVFGPRIWAVGTLNVPDYYEQPFDQLDFVMSWKVDRLKLSLKVKNILDSVARATAENFNDGTEEPVFRFRRGRRFSLGLGVDLD